MGDAVGEPLCDYFERLVFIRLKVLFLWFDAFYYNQIMI